MYQFVLKILNILTIVNRNLWYDGKTSFLIYIVSQFFFFCLRISYYSFKNKLKIKLKERIWQIYVYINISFFTTYNCSILFKVSSLGAFGISAAFKTISYSLSTQSSIFLAWERDLSEVITNSPFLLSRFASYLFKLVSLLFKDRIIIY